MIFLMNSFGSHDGKIDLVFLPLPKEVLKQMMWLPKLEKQAARYWDGFSASFAVLLEILGSCLVFSNAHLLVTHSGTF